MKKPFDILRYRHVAMGASGLFILAGVILFFVLGFMMLSRIIPLVPFYGFWMVDELPSPQIGETPKTEARSNGKSFNPFYIVSQYGGIPYTSLHDSRSECAH